MKKILIVDDQQQNVYMLKILLKTNGYEVETATNGIEALEQARKLPPELIISDILMPGMDGFSLCRAWKKDDKLKKVPFIFYTATYTDPKDEAFALSLGAERFLVKPTAPDELLAILKEMFVTQDTKSEVVHKKTLPKESEFYKEYNETLIRKLEDKMVQIERANKRLASLYQVSCDLATIALPMDLIHSVLRAIVKTVGYQGAIFFIFDEKKNKLFAVDGVGFSEIVLITLKEKYIFDLGERKGLVGLAAQTKQTILVSDSSKDPRWIAYDRSIKSALFIPVHYEKQLMGVISIFGAEKDAFNTDDERNLSSLANSMAISIINKKNSAEISQLNVQLEQRVNERTAQLQASNKELEAFAYSVSHDLRSSLRAINGFSHLLSEDYREKLNSEGKHLLDRIGSNISKMDQLIIDLLALSKVSLSEIQLKQIDMTALVTSVYQETASPEEQKRITFTVNPLPNAYGDPALIRQIWINLISNAIKYSRPNKRCSVQIDGHIEEKMCLYSIQDDGVGFDAKQADRLFGAFQRLHNSDQFEGTGVGLAIVKRIVQHHGGQVWAEGELNHGAKFTYSLPKK